MKKTYLKYITALLLFGSNGIVASNIQLSSYYIVFLRTLIGSVLLLIMYVVICRHFTFFRCKRDLFFICISGVAMGASWLLLYEAYARIGVGIASLLYYCGPVIVIALSPLVFGEKLTAIKLMSFAAVVCGVFLINGQAAKELNVCGVALGLFSAVAYAVMVITNKKAVHISGLENSLIQLVLSFMTVAVYTDIKNKGYAVVIEPNDIAWIIMLGVLNTGIGCYFYFTSIGSLPMQTVAVCGYIEPLSAVVMSALILGERLTLPQILGAAMIIGGAAMCELLKKPAK